MPPKPAESAASSALPPALDDLEAELKLKHSRKGVADVADVAATADASAARAVAAHDDGSSAVAQALAASGFKNRNPLFFYFIVAFLNAIALVFSRYPSRLSPRH